MQDLWPEAETWAAVGGGSGTRQGTVLAITLYGTMHWPLPESDLPSSCPQMDQGDLGPYSMAW